MGAAALTTSAIKDRDACKSEESIYEEKSLIRRARMAGLWRRARSTAVAAGSAFPARPAHASPTPLSVATSAPAVRGGGRAHRPQGVGGFDQGARPETGLSNLPQAMTRRSATITGLPSGRVSAGMLAPSTRERRD